jgi:hypothetical protein
MVDDACPHCGAGDITPHTSENLTTLIEKNGNGYIVLWSPETAEHKPDYRELGRFVTKEQAVDFLSQD